MKYEIKINNKDILYQKGEYFSNESNDLYLIICD